MTYSSNLSTRSFLTRPRVRNFLAQLALLLVLAGIISFFVFNASQTLVRNSTATGFAFLWNNASFELGTNLTGFAAGDRFLDAFVAGIVNTLAVSSASIIVATIAGIIIGMLRLSQNPLARTLAGGYVEIIRNVPLLLQMLFWYAIITKSLPSPRQALTPIKNLYLSNRGVNFALPEYQPVYLGMIAVFLILAVLLFVTGRRLRKGSLRGKASSILWRWRFSFLFGAPAALFVFAGMPFNLAVPQLKGFNFAGGGSITPECTAVFLGLTIYTAAFIAENVRSGILAVDAGQRNAARAIGLRSPHIMRFIIFPQALKIIIPPLASQYLNIVKNSSLAVAVGYADIIRVSTIVISETGQAIEVMALVMAIYLFFSLVISAVMNSYNRRVTAHGR